VDPGDDWRSTLAEAGELTGDVASAILETHGDRGRRAMEAVAERRVKRYRDFTVVVGHEDEYVIEGGECTCADARYNLDEADPEQRCWHVLAVEIAERVDAVDHHDMWYSEVREFL
jgi:predicted nucleic acid-binding Zn finger protein